jgi:hypothetical protein
VQEAVFNKVLVVSKTQGSSYGHLVLAYENRRGKREDY